MTPQQRDRSVAPARPLLLTIRQSAEILNLGRSTIYELIARGELEIVHVGAAARIPAEAIDAYVQRLRSEQNGVPS